MAEVKKLGRYELRSVLGKGAMGVVYEGFDPTLGRRVAVKTILKSAAFDDETERNYAERFVREAKAVGRLNHPNIVQVHDFGVENEVAYLVMEFIQGRELRSYFTGGERFETAEVVRIMGELLDALELAHEAGVIHRDIKPANVMLDMQRRVKLADFGVARVQDSDRSAAGTMVGTPAFMSPEQISGGKIDRRTDVFSAGVVLYQLLTGEQPFKGEGAWTVAKQIMQDDPPRPSSVVQSISPVFDGIVNKALAKKPGERFANAREFAAALRGVQSPTPAAVIPQPQPKARVEAKASETEIEFWRAIQNSSDAAEFEFYLEQFPDGTYAALARHKIVKLKEGPVQDAQATVRLEAEAQAKLKAAQEKAREEAEERARRETEAKARREAEEKALREALQKSRREAAARARVAVDEDATVAIGSARTAAAAPAEAPERKSSYALPAAIAAAVVVAGIGAFLFSGRTPSPAPVAQAPQPPTVAAPAAPAAPPKAELSAADVEKIRRETEDRIRREYADKSAAEQAKAARAAADKAVQEKQLALKAAADKAVQEKLLAAKATAEKAAAEKLAAEKTAADKAAAEKASRLAAEKAAEEKAAAARAAEEKLAAAKVPPVTVAAAAPREVGLAGRYAFRVMTASGPFQGCDRNGFEEDIEIRAGSAQAISGRQFNNLQIRTGQDGSIAATMFDGSNRMGSGDVKLTGRATPTGYAGSYEGRYWQATCSGVWTLVRK